MPRTPSNRDPDALRPQAQLRILGTTDLHVRILGYDYYSDAPCRDVGLARTARLIERAKAEVANNLLVDNGDFLQGNPLGDYLARRVKFGPDRLHPVFAAMQALGYDGATLGNHEFNYGLSFLQSVLTGAAFPVVLANIVRELGPTPAEDLRLFAPHAILTRDLLCADGARRPCRIGLIGFAPPQILQWDRTILNGALQARDILPTAEALVPELRAAGAEIVVALAHSGIEQGETCDVTENVAAHVAALPGVDAVVAGHTHQLFPSDEFRATDMIDPLRGLVAGKPAVMAGSNGSHLGVIDLQLAHGPEGWQVTNGQSHLRAIRPKDRPRGTPALRRIVQTVADDHRAALAYIRKPIGHSHIPLHSFFATIAPNQGMRLVAEAQAHWVASKLAGRPEAALPLLSSVAPFKAGGRGGPGNFTDIPPGPLSRRHAADLYMFPNTIAALRITGAELWEWLENSVGIYAQVAPGSLGTPLINPEIPAYSHERILGLSYTVDLSQPPRYDRQGRLAHPQARRIRDLCHFGIPVSAGQEFLLATNSYRAAGTGGYRIRPDSLLDLGPAELRDVLQTHIARGMPVRFSILPHFRFARLGARVIYETGPRAAAFLHEIADLRPEVLGQTEAGFLRLALHL